MASNFIIALYVLLPITLLTSHSLPSMVFYSLLVVSLATLIYTSFEGFKVRTWNYRWLICCYSVPLLVVVMSSWHHGEWAGANSEGASRFVLGLWIMLIALSHIEPRRLQHAIWGVYIGGVISAAVLFWLVATSDRRPSTPALIIVTYTSLMMLLSVITIFSLKWKLTPWFKLESALKILVAISIFTVFLTAQTRTGLLGLPVFVLLTAVLFLGAKNRARLITLLLISAAVLAAVVASNNDMRNRIAQGIYEIQTCKGEGSTQTSSMCVRMQMWRTAIDAGTNNPLFGLGNAGKFNDYLREVAVPNGWTTQLVADNFGEPHNDLLTIFAGFGFSGALGLLLIYLAPCIYFLPRLFSTHLSAEIRAAAAMGLAVCLGFFFFGLTETMFRRMNTIGFYTVMVALFMVLSEPKASRQDKPAPPAPS